MRMILLRLLRRLVKLEYLETSESALFADENPASKIYSMTMHVSTVRGEEKPFLKCQRSHKFARADHRGQATVNEWSVDAY